ncbi:DNA polymerase III subunit gamma/tau [Litorimonas sp. WD9-15]|uniref:DNA polymerase III subunit gamma/tau n=1 Tax=Litorimonas sp. WD9-15 TaxID=3418716 RepID=UPI003D03F23F
MSDAPSMFGDQESYQVLARKYRPSTFEDMIGQDAMVTTLKNAFEANRVAHAFMLTGVRGIGKTTTARLLARALNYETKDVKGPSVDLSTRGQHCELIMASSHMDVLEMDAASRTGVENMRELLDGVRYAPATARYKVYIIDEVHMLSAGAFNALLKTLEEPPDHAKFIFATTEIRKVPITVLSRCQRFDLRRVEASVLSDHLRGISDKEDVKISDEGLAMIARAAEGSVRDGLSLLDQAIVQAGLSGDEVTGEQVRTMLGLADRVRILDLFAMAASGDTKGALLEMRAQYDDGADPAVVMRDLLDVCHEVSRAKTLGDLAEFDMAPDQATRMRDLSATQSIGQLTRLWQVLSAAYNDVRQAPAPLAAAEMALLKLSLAGQMPPPELAAAIIEQAQKIQADGGPGLPIMSPVVGGGTASTSVSGSGVSTQAVGSSDGSGTVAALEAPKPVTPPKPALELGSFAEFVDALPATKIKLKYDLERYIRLVSFKRGAIKINITDPRQNSLIGKIVAELQEMTGDLWIVSPSDDAGEPPLAEQRKASVAAQKEKDFSHPAFQHPMLKNAKLLGIKDRPTNVIHSDFDKDN